MKRQTFECRICSPLSEESEIRRALEIRLPYLRWDEGDSSWDKVRVQGKGPAASISIYRYESPGPFQLTIVLEPQEGTDLEQAYPEWRALVLEAIGGWLWNPLEPQPVTIIKPHDRFPSAYEFECDRSLAGIKTLLDDAAFWFWETIHRPPRGLCLEGRIPSVRERVRIFGEKPGFSIEVGHWDSVSCDHVHETVQRTLLPAIGARNVRAAARIDP